MITQFYAVVKGAGLTRSTFINYFSFAAYDLSKATYAYYSKPDRTNYLDLLGQLYYCN
jgi:hypothetical protein